MDRKQGKMGRWNRTAAMAAAVSAAGLCLVLILCMAGATRTQAASASLACKYYTSVRIAQGDTLWDIAERYISDECGSMEDYVEEICMLNHISGDTIHFGQYLTVPYYQEGREPVNR